MTEDSENISHGKSTEKPATPIRVSTTPAAAVKNNNFALGSKPSKDREDISSR